MRKMVSVLLFASCFATAPEQYTATSGYNLHNIEGWKVLVNKELSQQREEAATQVLRLLEHQLYQISRVVPADALCRLQEVQIWVEYKNKDVKCMCYHPSRRWLTENGFNPDKAEGVEIGNAESFLKWTVGQPWMVLHELAHSYHHRVLGYDKPEIKEAYRRAVADGKYDRVLDIFGNTRRAYALNNDQEYFAETSEAYFGTNDIYPFVKSELAQHDPNMYDLLERLWARPVESDKTKRKDPNIPAEKAAEKPED